MRAPSTAAKTTTPAKPRVLRDAPRDDDATPQERELADELERALDADAVSIEDLVGTPAFLDALDALPSKLRQSYGFTFTVYDASRGPLAYMPDSDWGFDVPTEARIAERYGPGVYRVRPSCRRRKRGGGNTAEITVRIARERAPGDELAASRGDAVDREVLGRLFDLLEKRTEGELDARDAAAEAASSANAIPQEMPAWIGQVLEAVKAKETSELPVWLQPFASGLAQHLFGGAAGDAPAPATGASS